MEIFIGSFLGFAEPLNSAIHIRYSERKLSSPEYSGSEEEANLAASKVEKGSKTSCMIIHKPYEYLEPAIHSLFGAAEDVRIIVDRRFKERREACMAQTGEDRRVRSARRRTVPMLDILINVNG